MLLSYNLTEDDYVNFNLWHNLHSKTIKRTLLLTQIGLIGIFVMLWLIVYTLKLDLLFNVITAVFVLIMSVYVMVGFPKSVAAGIKKQTRKMLREGKNPSFIGPATFELLEHSIRTTERDTVTELACSRIERIVDTGSELYIYIGSLSGLILPQSAFSGREQREELIEALKRRVGEAVTVERPA